LARVVLAAPVALALRATERVDRHQHSTSSHLPGVGSALVGLTPAARRRQEAVVLEAAAVGQVRF
jgi:hypothetical protein